MRQLAEYLPTRFMAESSRYDKRRADFAVAFIQALKAGGQENLLS